MEKREIYLLGIGHGTPIFMELAEACGYTIAGLYHYNDERTGEIDYGYKILGSFEDLFRSDIKGKLFCLTMGDMNTKTLVSKRLMAMRGGVLQRFDNEFVFRKFFDKRWVLPALNTSHDCKLWRHCHADINIRLYSNPYITMKEKFTALLVQLGLYPGVNKLIKYRNKWRIC